MRSAVCWKCVEDEYLSKSVRREGERLKCSVCRKTRKSFSLDRLAGALDPVLREHIRVGREIPMSDDNDHTYYEQQGDPLSYWVQTILDQYFDFNDEIADALASEEDVDVADGDVPFYDDTAKYESTRVLLDGYYSQWNFVLEELKHGRRFFNSSAQALFEEL